MSGRKTLPQKLIRLAKSHSKSQHSFNMLVVTAFLRNNKLRRTHPLLSEYVISSPESDPDFASFEWIHTLEDVISVFELAIPKEKAVTNGAVYTPKYIRGCIVDRTFHTINDITQDTTIADISCGCGAFLVTAADHMVNKFGCTYVEAYSRIWGVDIDGDSIVRAKLLIALHTVLHGEQICLDSLNLHVANSLEFNFGEHKFDIIIGNPPYVRAKHIDPENKALMKSWDVCRHGNSDLYIPFFQLGLSLLKNNGILGFISVNSFIKSVNARGLRSFMSSGKYNITLVNFGEELIFKGRMAYTCLFFAQKKLSEHIYYAKTQPQKIEKCEFPQLTPIRLSSLNNFKGWNLNKSDILNAVNQIETTGTPLGKAYCIKNGIATLANSVFIFNPERDESKYYQMRTGDNSIQLIEKAICRDIIKPNILKTEEDIASKTEKLIFPYDTKGNLIAEHNFRESYPLAYEYLRSHIDVLRQRDKGKNDYPWYAFGRTQAINDKGIKLLFPYMTDTPHFIYTSDESILIYCGYAIYGTSENELLVLKKILESDVFAFYMKNTAKPYATGYYSYAKNYVKGFGIPALTDNEKRKLAEMKDHREISHFLCGKYGIDPTILISC